MKNKQLSKDEQLLNEKLNNLQFDYKQSDWEALENRLPNSSKGWLNGKGLIGAAAAVVIVVSSLYYYNREKDNADNNTVDAKEIVEKTIEKPVIEEKVEDNSVVNANEKIEVKEANPKSEPAQVGSKKETLEIQKSQNIDSKPSGELTEKTPFNEPSLSKPIAKDVKQDLDKEEFKFTELIVPSIVCSNAPIKMEIAFEGELPKDWTIDWIIDGNAFSSKQRITGIEVTESGIEKVSIQIRNEKNEIVEKQSKQIKSYEIAEIDFNYTDKQGPYDDLMVEAEVKENSFSNYKWINEKGEEIGNGEKLSYSFEQKGVYDLELVAITKEGCEAHKIKPVSVQVDFDPLAPNAFTPNQDGTNDIFRAEAFTIREDRFKMEIYNLQGEMIFRSSDSKDGWNGRFNNIGQMMPEGIYIWKVMISNELGQEKSFAGNLRLMK